MLILCFLVITFGLCKGVYENVIFSTSNFSNQFTTKLEGFIRNGKISLVCQQQLEQYMTSLNNKELWAMKMFDSGGKIPSGILEGYFSELGAFDECINIKHSKDNSKVITGKYCLANVPFNSDNNSKDTQKKPFNQFLTSFTLGICGPNACTAGELEGFYRNFIKNIRINKDMCQSKETRPRLEGVSIAAICFFAIILGAIVLSTAYEVVTIYLGNPSHPLLTSFSVLRNGKSLLRISQSSNQISCLYGLRVISTMWILLGHRFLVSLRLPLKNQFTIFEQLQNTIIMVVCQYTLAVDTFLLLSGFVLAYGYLNSASKGFKFNMFRHYIHRILRLTPTMIVMIILYLTVFIHIGNGPVWPTIINIEKERCEAYWWKDILYINNYGDDKLCLSQTWYLSVDMQLFAVSPAILIFLYKWPKFGILLIISLAIGSMAICFYVTWHFQINAMQMALNQNMLAFMTQYYTPTYTRATPWLIGIILGYYVFQVKRKQTQHFNNIIIILLWTITLVALPVCVFAGHNLLISDYNWLPNAFQNALVRPLWALAICWVIFASVIGYGGLINQFLSLPIFEVLGKLTYMIYMTHLQIMFLTSAQTRIAPMLTTSGEMHHFWGDFALTVAVSSVLFLVVEAPVTSIEAYIYRRNKPLSN